MADDRCICAAIAQLDGASRAELAFAVLGCASTIIAGAALAWACWIAFQQRNDEMGRRP